MKGSVKLLVNSESDWHSQKIIDLLPDATRVDFLVAFAKHSGFEEIMDALEKALKGGLKARIVVGLDFHLSDPQVLRKLHLWERRFKGQFELYVSDSSETFHPKIYAFEKNDGGHVIIGSANLTGGGMYGNYESSAMVYDPAGKMIAQVSSYLEGLIKDAAVARATKESPLQNLEIRVATGSRHIGMG